MRTLIFPARFRGPPDSANGGWACGSLAQFIDGPARVTLRSPLPLDTSMQVTEDGDGLRLQHGDTLLAEAQPVSDYQLDVPEPVSLEQAHDATKRFPWYHNHPYGECFVCGHARADKDSLRLAPGAVAGRDVAAAPWQVPADLCDDGVARTQVMWAALDCPSWFGFRAFDDRHGPVLLGRLTGHVLEPARVGEQCIVGGWHKRREGRKLFCGSVVWRADGTVLAAAQAIWIELKPKS